MLKAESKTEFINNRIGHAPESGKMLIESLFTTIPATEAANTRLPTTETCRSPSCTSPK